MLQHDFVIVRPPGHDHTSSSRLQDAARTNHETVQASHKLGTNEQHPQRATVPLHEQREHRHPKDVRECPTQCIKAKPAERRDERSDIDEESTRRDAGVLLACAAAAILGLIDAMQHYAKEMNMPTRFIQRLSLWMSVYLLTAVTGSVVMAESPVRADEGNVEAIELYRTSDNKLVNGGTVIGGIAGGVIGHQIGSGRGNTAATIAGALGGALVGNEIEKKQTQATRYRITVRLDSGSSLIVEDTRDLNLRVGDRVRIEDGHIYRI
jgi:outer membrane lipoprotein SlyB